MNEPKEKFQLKKRHNFRRETKKVHLQNSAADHLIVKQFVGDGMQGYNVKSIASKFRMNNFEEKKSLNSCTLKPGPKQEREKRKRNTKQEQKSDEMAFAMDKRFHRIV